VLGEATEQFDGEILVEEVAQRQRRDYFGADIGIGAGDHCRAGAHGRVGVGIDDRAEHAEHDISVFAAGRSGMNADDQTEPQAERGA
jgi:hypothetical protein